MREDCGEGDDDGGHDVMRMIPFFLFFFCAMDENVLLAMPWVGPVDVEFLRRAFLGGNGRTL